MTEIKWYRFEDKRYANPADEFGNSSGSHLKVSLLIFEVLSETSTGVWLYMFGNHRRFCKRNAKKRFACPTREEAFNSFRARKRKQIVILQRKIEDAKEAIYQAERTLF